jgi:hypothetical protein
MKLEILAAALVLAPVGAFLVSNGLAESVAAGLQEDAARHVEHLKRSAAMDPVGALQARNGRIIATLPTDGDAGEVAAKVCRSEALYQPLFPRLSSRCAAWRRDDRAGAVSGWAILLAACGAGGILTARLIQSRARPKPAQAARRQRARERRREEPERLPKKPTLIDEAMARSLRAEPAPPPAFDGGRKKRIEERLNRMEEMRSRFERRRWQAG